MNGVNRTKRYSGRLKCTGRFSMSSRLVLDKKIKWSPNCVSDLQKIFTQKGPLEPAFHSHGLRQAKVIDSFRGCQMQVIADRCASKIVELEGLSALLSEVS